MGAKTDWLFLRDSKHIDILLKTKQSASKKTVCSKGEYLFKYSLFIKPLYGIGCQIIRFYTQANQIKQEDKNIETHSFELTGRKNENVTLEVGYFFNEDYADISAIILENNAITEKLSDCFFMVFINPLAKVKLDEKLLSNIRYFHLSSIDDEYANFKWEN